MKGYGKGPQPKYDPLSPVHHELWHAGQAGECVTILNLPKGFRLFLSWIVPSSFQ